MGHEGLVGVRKDFPSIQENGRTRELDGKKAGLGHQGGAVAGLVGQEGSGGNCSAVGWGVLVEHLSPWDHPREDP